MAFEAVANLDEIEIGETLLVEYRATLALPLGTEPSAGARVGSWPY